MNLKRNRKERSWFLYGFTNFSQLINFHTAISLVLLLFINGFTHSQIISEAPPFALTIAQLKNWTADGSSADALNIVTTPLASRFVTTETQLNPVLDNTMKVVFAPDGMNGLGNYLEEQSKFNLYNFKHWSYIDKMIWFGGTSDKTLLIPAAPWVNTAHKNGVQVFGNLFLAPNVFGGSSKIVSDLLEKDVNGKFIAAEKLKAISSYYKFDGWFINMETNTNETNGLLMLEFVQELKAILPSDQEVIWYDAMLIDGGVRWQNELNTKNSTFLQNEKTRVSDGMFINFFWNGNSRPLASKQTAQLIGRSEYDVFTGVDLWPNRNQTVFESGGNDWMEALHDSGKPTTSLGLFVPNVFFQNDLYSNFRNVDTEIERQRFYDAEQQFFGGLDLNPQKQDATGFKGLNHWVPSTSVISQLPFETNFNTGHGKILAINGIPTTRNWHNIANQDILPTWQFAIDGSSDLKASYDFTKAYNGGTSIQVSGTIPESQNTTLKLYKTKLAISKDTKIDITYTLGTIDNTHMDLIMAFSDNPTMLIKRSIGTTSSSGWNIKTIDLKDLEGKELALLGFQFNSDTTIENYKINIGTLKIFNGNSGENTPPIAGFNANKTKSKVRESINFTSNASTAATSWLWSFEGGNPSSSTEENPTVRYDKIGSYPISLTVTNSFGSSVKTEMDYITVDNDPEPNFTTTNTVLEIGNSVSFTNTSSNTDTIVWSFPNGNPSTSTDDNPTIIYNEVGAFDVSITATNKDNTVTKTSKRLISITDPNAIDHTDPVDSGIISARAEISESESGESAFDNFDFSKWLDNGGIPTESNPSWIEIELPTKNIVNTLVIISANDGPERDPKNFQLLGSNDGINFVELNDWEGILFEDRFQRKTFPFMNTKAYKFYRLEISQNNESVNLTQLSEIELRGPDDTTLHTQNTISNKGHLITLYPNPTNDILNIEGDFPTGSSVELYNLQGNLVQSAKLDSKNTLIKLSKIAKGLYLIKINSPNTNSYVEKIILE